MSPRLKTRKALQRNFTPEQRKQMRESYVNNIIPRLEKIKTQYKIFDTWDKLFDKIGISRRNFWRWKETKRMSHVYFELINDFIEKYDKGITEGPSNNKNCT